MIQFEKDKKGENRHKLVVLLLTTACVLIAKHWENSMVPTKEDWHTKVWHIMLIQKLSAIVKTRLGHTQALERFKNAWKPFLDHCAQYGKGQGQTQILDLKFCILFCMSIELNGNC